MYTVTLKEYLVLSSLKVLKLESRADNKGFNALGPQSRPVDTSVEDKYEERAHDYTYDRHLFIQLTEAELESLQDRGTILKRFFHPLWLESGLLCVLISTGRIPKTGKEVEKSLSEGWNLAPFTISRRVLRNLRSKKTGATRNYGPFKITVVAARDSLAPNR